MSVAVLLPQRSLATRAYVYDDAGNIRQKGNLKLLYDGGVGGAQAVTRVQDLGSGTDLGSYVYTDDSEATLITRDAGETIHLMRDDEGRIAVSQDVSPPWGTPTLYEYDGAGQRARTINLGGSTGNRLYVTPEYEVDLDAGTYRVLIRANGTLVATVDRPGDGSSVYTGAGETLRFHHQSFIGSNVLTTSETGAVVERVQLSPYGEILSASDGVGPLPAAGLSTDRIYNGEEHDLESGLQYLGARMYDPWIGRFVSADPALTGRYEVGMLERSAIEPLNANLYAYALNSPTNYSDPTGLWGVWTAWTTMGQSSGGLHSFTISYGVSYSIKLGGAGGASGGGGDEGGIRTRVMAAASRLT